jgi:Uma2 family endonuclease
MWNDEELKWLEENRETLENDIDWVFELASDDNFESGLTDGLYQKLSIAIANIQELVPEVVISPDSDKEFMIYFCLGGYAIYTFPSDPEANVMSEIKKFFSDFSKIPENIYLPVINRAHTTIREW